MPPVRLSIDDAQVDDQPVIVATVHECDPSAKPCRVQSTGLAYLRSYDGDYALSAIEEQAFLAARKAPHFDREAVSGTTWSDLDGELVAAADLPPAQFIDEGIRFTVVLRRTRHSDQGFRSRSADDGSPIILPAGTNLAEVYRVLTEPRTAADIAERTGLTKASVRKALQSLRDHYGIIEQHGGRGRHTTYERRPGSRLRPRRSI